MSGLGSNGPYSGEYAASDDDDGADAAAIVAASTTIAPTTADEGEHDGTEEGEQTDHGYEQGQGGT